MELRLFPLGRVVLFPGMALTLQVFEPRYRALVTECLEHDAPFGVVLIREGSEAGEVGDSLVPHSIGTTARITAVIPGPDGRLHLHARGERRFRILSLHHDHPYLHAEVEFPLDEEPVVTPSIIEQAREGLRQLERLRATVGGGYDRSPELPEAAGSLADRIACVAGVDAPDEDAAELQRLLETLDAGRRLHGALPLLERAITWQHQRASMVVAARWAGFGAAN